MESQDSGLSFVPYPNTGNLSDSITLLSAGPENIGGPDDTGTGPQWVVTVGDYHYMYYQDGAWGEGATSRSLPAHTCAGTPAPTPCMYTCFEN